MQRMVCGKLFGCNGLRRDGQVFAEFGANFTQKPEKPVVGNPSEPGNLGPGGRRSGEFLTSIVTTWASPLCQQAGRDLRLWHCAHAVWHTVVGTQCVPYSSWHTLYDMQSLMKELPVAHVDRHTQQPSPRSRRLRPILELPRCQHPGRGTRR